MTQTIQPGQHPDADQLSAFAEHALPPHEQQQMLAHLAACSDCRALIYLSQDAIPEATIQPQPVATHKPLFGWNLFRGWTLAFPAAAAIACLIFVTLHFRNTAVANRKAAADNTAKLEQAPPPLPATPPPAQPALPDQLKAAPVPAPKPLAKIPAPSISLDEKTATNPAVFHGNAQPLGGLGGFTAGRAGAVANSNSNAELKAATASRQSSLGRATTANFGMATSAPAAAPALPGSLGGPLAASGSSQDEVSASDSALGGLGGQSAAGTTPRPAPSAPVLHSLNSQYSAAPPLPPPPQAQTGSPAAVPGSVTETVTVSSAAAQIDTESSASSAVISGAALSSLQVNKARLTENRMAKKQPTLPSRLPALATLSSAGHQLALDTAGTLFRSDNAGVTWQPVSVQWTGRAVKIALAPSPPPQTKAPAAPAIATAAPTAAAAKPSPTPPPIFELTNNAGQLWTSPDGQAWKQK